MKKKLRTSGGNSLLKIREHYEAVISERETSFLLKTQALIHEQSKITDATISRLTELEKTAQEIKTKVSSPRKPPGLLENIDASAVWVIVVYVGTLLYNDAQRGGMPYAYALFHVAANLLIYRIGVWLYLMLRKGLDWKEIAPINNSLLFVAGLSYLVDCYVKGRFESSPNVLALTLQSMFGGWMMYSALVTYTLSFSRHFGNVSSSVSRYWKSLKIFGVPWITAEQPDLYQQNPELLLEDFLTLEQQAMRKLPIIVKPLFAAEFWRTKRQIKAFISLTRNKQNSQNTS